MSEFWGKMPEGTTVDGTNRVINIVDSEGRICGVPIVCYNGNKSMDRDICKSDFIDKKIVNIKQDSNLDFIVTLCNGKTYKFLARESEGKTWLEVKNISEIKV